MFPLAVQVLCTPQHRGVFVAEWVLASFVKTFQCQSKLKTCCECFTCITVSYY